MVKSLRWQLQIWHAIVLIVVLAIFGTVVYSLHWQTRLQQIDAELDRTAEVLMSRLRRLLPMPPFRLAPRIPGPPGDGAPRSDLSRGDAPRPDPNREPGRDDRQFRLNERPHGDEGRSEGRRRDFSRSERGIRLPSPREGASHERPVPGLGLPEEFQHLFEGDDASRFYFVIFGHEGAILEKSSSAPEVGYPDLHLAEDGLPVRSVRVRDHFREVIHVSRGDVNVLVGKSLAADQAAEHRYGLLLILAGGGVLAAGCLGGGWLTAHAIRPIASMTATAQSISAQNFKQRIDLEDTATELGQLATVLNQTFDRLESSFEQQSRFTADASHELRTPLAVILAHTELALARRRTPEEYQTTLETCQRASIRMKSLIEDLLMLARFDAQPQDLHITEFDLSQLAGECIELLQPLAGTRQIRIEKDLKSIAMRGDRDRVFQVLTNLLSNSIRYNKPDGFVKVSLSPGAGVARLRVSDTGVGIPADELPHVFERFYRVDKARSRAEGGSGLGLSICKTIVDAHRGRIQIHSEHHKGTTVEVDFPIA